MGFVCAVFYIRMVMLKNLNARVITSVILISLMLLLLIASSSLFSIVASVVIAYSFVTELPKIIPLYSLYYQIIAMIYAAVTMYSLAYTFSFSPQFFFLETDVSPLYVFASAWLCDTTAYFTGSLLGRHKMSPVISPKKTWEGFLGAVLASIAFHVWLNTQIMLFPSLYLTVFYAIGVTIAATLGDLFISFLKRKSGAKDTGTLLPGHGGILDRFDSVIGVAIYVALSLYIQLKLF